MTSALLRISGSAAVLIGLTHLLVGLITYGELNFDALWFLGSGLAVILIGILTLLASSNRSWKALSAASLAANAAGLLLAVGFGVLTEWTKPQGPVLILVFMLGAVGCAYGLRHTGS